MARTNSRSRDAAFVQVQFGQAPVIISFTHTAPYASVDSDAAKIFRYAEDRFAGLTAEGVQHVAVARRHHLVQHQVVLNLLRPKYDIDNTMLQSIKRMLVQSHAAFEKSGEFRGRWDVRTTVVGVVFEHWQQIKNPNCHPDSRTRVYLQCSSVVTASSLSHKLLRYVCDNHAAVLVFESDRTNVMHFNWDHKDVAYWLTVTVKLSRNIRGLDPVDKFKARDMHGSTQFVLYTRFSLLLLAKYNLLLRNTSDRKLFIAVPATYHPELTDTRKRSQVMVDVMVFLQQVASEVGLTQSCEATFPDASLDESGHLQFKQVVRDEPSAETWFEVVRGPDGGS
jgi:hypothetical protein